MVLLRSFSVTDEVFSVIRESERESLAAKLIVAFRACLPWLAVTWNHAGSHVCSQTSVFPLQSGSRASRKRNIRDTRQWSFGVDPTLSR